MTSSTFCANFTTINLIPCKLNKSSICRLSFREGALTTSYLIFSLGEIRSRLVESLSIYLPKTITFSFLNFPSRFRRYHGRRGRTGHHSRYSCWCCSTFDPPHSSGTCFAPLHHWDTSGPGRDRTKRLRRHLFPLLKLTVILQWQIHIRRDRV